MIRRVLLLAVALAWTPLPTTVGAQVPQVRLPVQPPYRQLGPAKSHEDSQPIPAAYRPPPGMCRIWLDNVPASQQPAPTDCVSAVRNRPNNARVIFGDDYVEKRGRGKDKDRDKEKKPDSHVDAGDVESTDSLEAVAPPRGGLALALASRVHGPQSEDVAEYAPEVLDARPFDEPSVVASADQPPARRRTGRPDSPAARRAQARDSVRRDPPAERDRVWREPDVRAGASSSLSEQRRALRERRAATRDGRKDRDDRYDRDDWDDDRDDRWDRDGRGNRDGRDDRDRRLDVRDPRLGYGVPLGGVYGGVYGNGYGYYPAPGRANGTCLDRDGDGWCDDSRTGGGYCLDRDGDGRCDDYPELASAPFSSSMPPMAAAVQVQRGAGSQLALRWLGTAEVMVRTSELKRTGTPYRAMWLDASTSRLLQVWTDRDGDGIADRVEIYRNGRVSKIIGR